MIVKEARKKLREILETAKTDGVIGDWIDSVGMSVLDVRSKRKNLPFVVLGPSYMESSVADSFNDNLRTYAFGLSVVFKADVGNEVIEDVAESLVDRFDEKLTLDGKVSWILPTVSPAVEVEGNRDYVVVDIVVRIVVRKRFIWAGQ